MPVIRVLEQEEEEGGTKSVFEEIKADISPNLAKPPIYRLRKISEFPNMEPPLIPSKKYHVRLLKSKETKQNKKQSQRQNVLYKGNQFE